jgi:hypothetical protein
VACTRRGLHDSDADLNGSALWMSVPIRLRGKMIRVP